MDKSTLLAEWEHIAITATPETKEFVSNKMAEIIKIFDEMIIKLGDK